MKDEPPDMTHTVRIMEQASIEVRVEILEEATRNLTIGCAVIAFALYYVITQMVSRDELPKGA